MHACVIVVGILEYVKSGGQLTALIMIIPSGVSVTS